MNRSRLVVLYVALAGAGCDFNAKTCTTTADCVGTPTGTTCQMGYCVMPSDGGTMGGGSGGGGGMTGGGGGGGGGSAYCDAGVTSACAAWEQCAPSNSGGACVAKALELNWVSPSNNGLVRGPANAGFNAVVSVDAGAGTTLPSMLPLTQEDGGVALMLTLDMAQRLYSGPVTLAGPDGAKVLIAGWPASSVAGHSARQTVTWDGTGPELSSTPLTSPQMRDELFPMSVSSNEPVTVSAVDVRVGGVRMGESDAGTCASNAGCWVLDMSRPTLNAMSGDFTVVVTASDAVGNSTTFDAGTVHVTRKRWEVQPSLQVIRATPAIGADGTVFVAGADATSSLYALNHLDGGTLRNISLGSTLSVATATSNGTEYVYFSAVDGSGGKVGAVNASTFAAAAQPAVRGNGSGPTNAAIALVGKSATEVGAVGAFNAVGAGNASRVTVYSAGLAAEGVSAADGGSTFNFQGVPSPAETATNILVNGTEAWLLNTPVGGGFFWQAIGNVTGTPTIGVRQTLEPTGTAALAGQVVFGNTSLVSGAVQAQKLYSVSGTSLISGTLTSNVDNGVPALGSGVGYLGRGNALVRFDPSALGTGGTQLATGVNIRTSPVLGKAGPNQAVGLGYALADDGTLFAFVQDANTASNWGSVFTLTTSVVYAHPTLDCNRRLGAATTTTGVLYVAASNGWVSAIIVDSPKLLDTTGAWPKFQRTAGNSGNSDAQRFELNPGCPP